MRRTESKRYPPAYAYFALMGFLFLAYNIHPGVGIYDTEKELAYIEQISRTWRTGELHWSPPSSLLRFPAIRYSDSFIGNPETWLMSPLSPLALVLSPARFIKLVSFVMFAVGVLGAVKMRDRFDWDDHQFTVFTVAFFASPIVVQHLAIGYLPWLNLFLFPWLMYFAASERTRTHAIGVGAVIGLTVMQGGIHPGLWFAFLYALYMLWQSRFATLLSTAAVSLVVAAPRIAATAMTYGEFSQAFQSGYGLGPFFFWAIIPPVFISEATRYVFLQAVWSVPAWDGGIYWGPVLVLVGILLWRRPKLRVLRTDQGQLSERALVVSILVLVVFSFYSIFENTLGQFPILGAGLEKYPYRFMIPAYFGLTIVLAQKAHELLVPRRHILVGVPLLLVSAEWMLLAVSQSVASL